MHFLKVALNSFYEKSLIVSVSARFSHLNHVAGMEIMVIFPSEYLSVVNLLSWVSISSKATGKKRDIIIMKYFYIYCWHITMHALPTSCSLSVFLFGLVFFHPTAMHHRRVDWFRSVLSRFPAAGADASDVKPARLLLAVSRL